MYSRGCLRAPYAGVFLVIWLTAGLSLVQPNNAQPYVQGSYPVDQSSYDYQVSSPNSMALAAFKKLKNSPVWVGSWGQSLEPGQVSAVAVDGAGRVLAFHRAGRAWDARSFDFDNRYRGPDTAIPDPTVLVLDSNGTLLDVWGENLFYMPHGLTVDKEDNVWVTDVALHQVFKFTPSDHKKPALVLGTRFVPGDDEEHFCKPAAVAVLSSGDFFVADGYCNTRVVKYNRAGQKILQWGRDTAPSRSVPPPYSLFVPHGLALAEERGLVCVADRENGRVQCFLASNGTFHSQYHNWLIGSRLFSVAYSPHNGGRLYVVNGPSASNPLVRGFVIDMDSGRLLQWFNPPGAGFRNPHDVAVSPDGRSVYVAELDPHRLHRFDEAPVADAPRRNVTGGGGGGRETATRVPAAGVKPTATIEEAGVVWRGVEGGAWLGVAGGAAGGLGAVLLCATLAAVALLRARRTGWLKARHNRRRWEYAGGEFKLRRLLERPRGFQRVNTDESDDEPAPHAAMLQPVATA